MNGPAGRSLLKSACHSSRPPALFSRLREESAYIPAATPATFCPVCVPIGTVRTSRAALLAAPHRLLAQVNLGMVVRAQCTGGLKLCPGENQQAPEVVLVEFFDRVEQIAIERHQATESGANNLVTVRRSVSVQPCGGVIRSEWLAQSG